MDKELFIATTQRNLVYAYYVLFAVVLVLVLVRPPMLDEFGQAVLQTLLGGLLVLVTQQSGYFFARQRDGRTPDSTNAPMGGTDETSRTEP